MAEAGRVERPRRVSTFTGFKPDKHATCAPLWLAESGPLEGHALASTRRLATACSTLAASLSLLVGSVRIARTSLRLKGGSLSR